MDGEPPPNSGEVTWPPIEVEKTRENERTVFRQPGCLRCMEAPDDGNLDESGPRPEVEKRHARKTSGAKVVALRAVLIPVLLR